MVRILLLALRLMKEKEQVLKDLRLDLIKYLVSILKLLNLSSSLQSSSNEDIFKNATKRLIIIDTYADNTLLDIVKRLNIQVIIITKKDNLLTYQDIKKYNKQYHNLKVIYNNTFHDRYFIVDDDIYHCGASINRIGYKTFSITLLKDKDICLLLMERVCEIINTN